MTRLGFGIFKAFSTLPTTLVPTMSADDNKNFPPGTHLLEDRMSLFKLRIPTNFNFDIESSNRNEKRKLILKPAPSVDPEDPLVGHDHL